MLDGSAIWAPKQAEAALALWDGQGCFVFTGSAGIYAREDGSRVSEDDEVFPPGKDERTDRCGERLRPASAAALVLGCLPSSVVGAPASSFSDGQ